VLWSMHLRPGLTILNREEKVNSNWFAGNVQKVNSNSIIPEIRILYYNVESNKLKRLQFSNDHNYKVYMKI